MDQGGVVASASDEDGRQASDAGARLTALRALSGAGDTAAIGILSAAMAEGSPSAARVLAETGNPDGGETASITDNGEYQILGTQSVRVPI